MVKTTGRIPAFSHSEIPEITSARDSGGTSLSTASAEVASGLVLVNVEHPAITAPVSTKLLNVGINNDGLHGSGKLEQLANATPVKASVVARTFSFILTPTRLLGEECTASEFWQAGHIDYTGD